MTRVVFFGNEQLAQGLTRTITPAFDGLIDSGYDIAALVLPRRPNPRSRREVKLAIAESAERQNVLIIYADEETDLVETLRSLNAEIGVLASFGMMVPDKIIDLFARGIVNIHPSLLPNYRGSTPIETALVNGDAETGVSLMRLVRNMDAGPIFAQKTVAIAESESKQSLYEKLAAAGAKMLLASLPKILSGKLVGQNQDENNSTYTKTLTKADGNLDPNIMTATECERKVRAYLGFPKTRLQFLGREAIITKAKALNNFDGDNWPDVVQCANNSALQIIEIISPNSGKQMKVADYLNGLENQPQAEARPNN